MNRQRLLGLLAGSLITAVTAVPAFAEGPSDKVQAAVAGAHGQSEAKANRGLAAHAKRRAFQGELTKAVDGTAPALSLTLETKRGDTIVVTTTADTKLRGKGHEDLTLAGLKSLEPGTRIIAVGERDGDELVAKRLIVRPAKQDKDEREDKDEQDGAAKRTVTTGVASNVSIAADGTGSLTVTPQGGSAVTILVDANTHYQLKGVAGLANGQTVRVASTKNDAGQNVAKQVRVPAGS